MLSFNEFIRNAASVLAIITGINYFLLSNKFRKLQDAYDDLVDDRKSAS